jgi:hypothetical protein
MRCSLVWLQALLLVLAVFPVQAATGRVIKVLPLFLDLKGQHTISPSLYDRDAYQAQLRSRPELRSGIVYAVQWKSKGSAAGPLMLRVELRGVVQGDQPKRMTLEQSVTARSRFSHWTRLTLGGEEYKTFGEVTAWRVSLWEGKEMLGSQQSFLW